MRHDRALPVAIHGMMPARAERGDGSEEKKSLLDIESEGKLTVNRWGMPRMGLWSSRRRIAVPTRHVTVMSPRTTLARQIPAPRYHVAVERVLHQRVYLILCGVKHACCAAAAPNLPGNRGATPRQKVEALILLCRGQRRDTPGAANERKVLRRAAREFTMLDYCLTKKLS